MGYNFDFSAALWFLAILILSIWGLWELVDWLWIGDVVIESSTPIIPELKIIVKNNIVDTVYVYRTR